LEKNLKKEEEEEEDGKNRRRSRRERERERERLPKGDLFFFSQRERENPLFCLFERSAPAFLHPKKKSKHKSKKKIKATHPTEKLITKKSTTWCVTRAISLSPSLSLPPSRSRFFLSLSLSFLSSLVRLSSSWMEATLRAREKFSFYLSLDRSFRPKKKKNRTRMGDRGLTLTFNTNSLSSLHAGETSERGDVATHRWFLSRRGVCEHF